MRGSTQVGSATGTNTLAYYGTLYLGLRMMFQELTLRVESRERLHSGRLQDRDKHSSLLWYIVLRTQNDISITNL